jgi:hypothetical protein
MEFPDKKALEVKRGRQASQGHQESVVERAIEAKKVNKVFPD